MKINTDTINSISFTVLECQADLILRALELYAYNLHYICPRNDVDVEYVSLRNDLIYYTYQNILGNLGKNKYDYQFGILDDCKEFTEKQKRYNFYNIRGQYKNVV